MDLYTISKMFGIATYAMLVMALVSGLFRWKLKIHKTFAFSAIFLATLHFLLIIISG